ncbi:MAG: hypothetical protein L3J45_03625 [Flavobacteriaceae bacterium]|nr:hypothetical protein [Flavobacteriaceae bacterium]
MSLKKIAILLLIPLMGFTAHKYYLSLTQIDYKPQEKTLQISMRLFIDDIEKSLESNFREKFNLDTPNELPKTNNYIAFYLNNHFRVTVNNKPTNYTFLGKEYENDIVYFYIEIDSVPPIKSIGVQNTILMNAFDSQKNIIKLNINNQKKTMLLNKSNDKDLLNF